MTTGTPHLDPTGRPDRPPGTAAEATPGKEKLAAVLEHFATGHRTVGEMVVQVLRQAIQSGAFAPGEWLRQEYLAEAIGVSRIPVRTALLQLEAEGLVTMHAHRGAQVRVQSPAQIEEIYRLRVLLETYGLRLSMVAMSPERLARMRALADRLDTESEGGDFLQARVQFYREVYDAERNPLLVEHIESLRSQLGRYLLGFRFDEHRTQHHRALVDCVAAGDLTGAENWLRSHLDGVRAGVLSTVQDSDRPETPTRRPARPCQRPGLRRHVADRGSHASTAKASAWPDSGGRRTVLPTAGPGRCVPSSRDRVGWGSRTPSCTSGTTRRSPPPGSRVLIFDYRGFGDSDGDRGSSRPRASAGPGQRGHLPHHPGRRRRRPHRRLRQRRHGRRQCRPARRRRHRGSAPRSASSLSPTARDWLHRMRSEAEWLEFLERPRRRPRLRAATGKGRTGAPARGDHGRRRPSGGRRRSRPTSTTASRAPCSLAAADEILRVPADRGRPDARPPR